MKRLQLPKNKLARLAINVAFIVSWWNIYQNLIGQLWFDSLTFYFGTIPFYQNNLVIFLYHLSQFSIVLIPIGLITKFIWFSKPRITRSKED
tara:strand:+ start:245 stop:520 length:276 start_codon:yes stop_codon:yes gene_type:complete